MDRHIKRAGISLEISVLDFLSQVINAVAVIALIIIALVYALHKQLSVIYIRCEGVFKQVLYFDITNGASFHGKEIILLVYPAPIYRHRKLFSEHHIQPYAH